MTLHRVVEASYRDRSERKTCPVVMKIWISIALIDCYKHTASKKSAYNRFYHTMIWKLRKIELRTEISAWTRKMHWRPTKTKNHELLPKSEVRGATQLQLFSEIVRFIKVHHYPRVGMWSWRTIIIVFAETEVPLSTEDELEHLATDLQHLITDLQHLAAEFWIQSAMSSTASSKLFTSKERVMPTARGRMTSQAKNRMAIAWTCPLSAGSLPVTSP